MMPELRMHAYRRESDDAKYDHAHIIERHIIACCTNTHQGAPRPSKLTEFAKMSVHATSARSFRFGPRRRPVTLLV